MALETIQLEIIIDLVLIWLMGKKVFPQIILMFLTLITLLHHVINDTNLDSIIGELIIFASLMIYSALQIIKTGEKEEMN